MLLQTLNLIAAIFIDNAEQKAGMSPGLQGTGARKIALATRQQQPTSLRLLDTVNEVLEEVHRAAEEVFNQAVRRSQVQVRFEFFISVLIFVLSVSLAGRPGTRPQTS